MGDSKKSAWDGYRQWLPVGWILLAIWVFLAVINTPGEIMTAVFLLFLFESRKPLFFRCPRCREFFFFEFWKGRFLPIRKCVHCGLPKWAEPPYEPLVDPQSSSFGQPPCPTPKCDELLPTPESSGLLQLANFLTLVLRDDPGAIHLSLDSAGWADINNLLTRANRYGFKLTREDLADVLTASEDQRFEWDQPGGRIRWSKS